MREGHLFHKRLVLARQWDIYLKARFESLRTFLPAFFCLGLETKGAKLHPPKKKIQRLGGHTSLKSFLLQTAPRIFLTSLETLLFLHRYELMSFRKNWLRTDATEPLQWHSDFFSTSPVLLRLFHMLCMIFPSATLQNYT